MTRNSKAGTVFRFSVSSSQFSLNLLFGRKLANLSTYLLLPVLCKQAVNEGCIQLPCAKVGVSQDLPMQRNRSVDTFNNEHFQRSGHARNRFGPISAAYHQLGDQCIIVSPN